jgi:hypothetical protein
MGQHLLVSGIDCLLGPLTCNRIRKTAPQDDTDESYTWLTPP